MPPDPVQRTEYATAGNRRSHRASSPGTDQAPAAAVNVSLLLARDGDPLWARAAFERAIESGHPDVTSVAIVNLGVPLDTTVS
jgi:hypothetical protein